GYVLYPGIQSGLDLPGWILVDRDAAGRGKTRPACRADSNLERDGLVRGLRLADGLQLRAARLNEPGDSLWQMDWLPSAGAAGSERKAWREIRLHLSGQSWGSMGGR